MIHTNPTKIFEEKGRTEQLNEVLKSENASLKKKIGGTKTDLSFATKIKFSFFGAFLLFGSFIMGYIWYNNVGEIEFDIQNTVFLFILCLLAIYSVLYLLDDVLDIIKL
jgi:hypothetical protein